MLSDSQQVKIVVLPGDGVGPEVVQEAQKVLECVAYHRSLYHHLEFKFENHLIGGIAIDQTGSPLPENTLEACKTASAILLGSVGGPSWPKTPSGPRPEQGLLEIRKALNLFANIRPCYFPADCLLDKSPLKREIVQGAEFTVVRELTGGLYFGKRQEEVDGSGNFTSLRFIFNLIAYDTMSYSVDEVQRITRIAGHLSMLQDPPLPIISIDKANVLASSRLWKRVVTETLAKEFPKVPLSHHLVDSAAMVMVMNPRKLNGILLTENMVFFPILN